MFDFDEAAKRLGEQFKEGEAQVRLRRSNWERTAEDKDGLVAQALKSCVEKLAATGVRCHLNIDPKSHQVTVIMPGGPVGVTLPTENGTRPVIEQAAILAYYQRPNGLVIVSRTASYFDHERQAATETIKIIDPADTQALNQFDFSEDVAKFVEWAIERSYRGATKEATERANGLK
jgi:hypothetical protein